MMIINTVIVESHGPSVEHLGTLLRNNCPQVNLIATFPSAEEALEVVPRLHFDLLFLNIEKKDDYDVFSLLDDLDLSDVQLIFTSTSDLYRRQASEANTIKYLLKPIEKDELIKAVERSMFILIGKKNLPNIQHPYGDAKVGKIVVYSGGVSIFINPKDILYIEADGAYSRIYHLSGSDMQMTLNAHNLGSLAKILDPNIFLRVHKKYVININYAKSCHKNKLRLATETNEVDVRIAKDRENKYLTTLRLTSWAGNNIEYYVIRSYKSAYHLRALFYTFRTCSFAVISVSLIQFPFYKKTLREIHFRSNYNYIRLM